MNANLNTYIVIIEKPSMSFNLSQLKLHIFSVVNLNGFLSNTMEGF